MTVIEEIRKTVSESTPVLAVVGATDLAVERVRKITGDTAAFQEEVETRVAKLQEEVETRVAKLQEEVEKTVSAIDPAWLQNLLTKAFDPRTLQSTAQQVQSTAQHVPALAVSRALEVAGQVESRYESLAARGKTLVGRVQSQKATQDLISQSKVTLTRTKAAVSTARKAVDDTTVAAKGTRTAAKRTSTTARNRTAATRSAVKGAATSTRKTAAKAVDAVEAAADKLGD